MTKLYLSGHEIYSYQHVFFFFLNYIQLKVFNSDGLLKDTFLTCLFSSLAFDPHLRRNYLHSSSCIIVHLGCITITLVILLYTLVNT
jgi:hypothetical protein